jgi:putative acetyltransferase
MYTHPDHRRRGVARKVLEALEAAAAAMGYGSLRLETGRPQPEAIALYRAQGYHTIPGFGAHAHDDRTVSFEKMLEQRREPAARALRNLNTR